MIKLSWIYCFMNLIKWKWNISKENAIHLPRTTDFCLSCALTNIDFCFKVLDLLAGQNFDPSAWILLKWTLWRKNADYISSKGWKHWSKTPLPSLKCITIITKFEKCQIKYDKRQPELFYNPSYLKDKCIKI